MSKCRMHTRSHQLLAIGIVCTMFLVLQPQWSSPRNTGTLRRAISVTSPLASFPGNFQYEPLPAMILNKPNRPTSRPLAPIYTPFQSNNNNSTAIKPPTSIALVGERHSGSNWLTDHLQECFPAHNVTPRFHRWKHWFQDDRNNRQAVLVATFRNPFDWVMAMHLKYPYHSPAHFTSDWYDFVTTPWTLPNYTAPTDDTECQQHYTPREVVPCREEERDHIVFFDQTQRNIVVRATYELSPEDGLPFPSILNLRAAKNRHFVSLGQRNLAHSFFPVQYEYNVEHGSSRLIHQLEQVLQTKAQCQPTEPQQLTHRPYPKAFIAWMRDHVDWEAESLVGYTPEDYYLSS